MFHYIELRTKITHSETTLSDYMKIAFEKKRDVHTKLPQIIGTVAEYNRHLRDTTKANYSEVATKGRAAQC